ncbi:hypothetical protein [Phycicoccus avicenniae]|uniref:hypothetical protein n=1 Tax=Phycicoccus avicenniae TaxID=2828860 RepID=UPI003D2BA394
MDPMQALEGAENALRLAIQTVLGNDWMSSPGAPPQTSLQGVRKNEQTKRPSVAVSSNLLDYTYTKDLVNIVDSNRQAFEPVFPKWEIHMALLSYLVDVRNTIAHSRALVPHERDLVSGIAGEVRNCVSMYLGSTNPATKLFYPSIVSGVDSLGQVGDWRSNTEGTFVLEVGQEVTITCSASDPFDRDLEWMVARGDFFGGSPEWKPRHTGTEFSFVWVPQEEHVSVGTTLTVFMRSIDRFHRYSDPPYDSVDDFIKFTYFVAPPVARMSRTRGIDVP